MVFLILLLMGWLALLVQAALGSPPWMFGGQFLPLLTTLLYATIYTQSANAWTLSLLYGILWDALLGSKMGITSACLIAVVGLVMTQPLSKLRQNPLLQLVVCVAAFTLFLVLHFLLAYCLERQRITITPQLIWSTAASSLLNGVFCLIFNAMLHPVLIMLGHQPPRDLRYHV